MYQLIYADPPWRYDNVISNGAAGNHYSTMTLTDLMRLPVWSIAAENAVLAMWYTGTHNAQAVKLAEAWGFQVRTMKGFTWVKLNQLAEQHINKALAAGQVEDFYDFLELLNTQTRMNGGNYTRANSEDLLIAVRGTGLERASASVKQAFYSPLSEHSEKPAEVRFRLEQLYGDVTRIELFSRGDAPGWHHWGNECPFPDVELMPASSRPLPNSRISLVKAQAGHYQAVPLPPLIPIQRQHIEVTLDMVQLAGVKVKKPIYPEKKDEYPPLGEASSCSECAVVGPMGLCVICGEQEDDIDWNLMMNNAGKMS